MKLVLYKANGVYCVTNEANYNAVIQNAREIHIMQDFESADEVIAYFCTYFGSKVEDFIVLAEKSHNNDLLDDLLMEQQEQI